jgi:hypothetical protein
MTRIKAKPKAAVGAMSTQNNPPPTKPPKKGKR